MNHQMVEKLYIREMLVVMIEKKPKVSKEVRKIFGELNIYEL
jgi:hypothetical protein